MFIGSKKTGLGRFFYCAAQSGFFGGHLGIVSNQCHQGILLTARQLAEALQQLALVQGQVWAVQAHVEVITQSAFLEHALLKASNDLRVHAAVMVACDIRNTFAHAIWQTNYEFVSGAAGIECWFHRARTLNRLVQESDTGNGL